MKFKVIKTFRDTTNNKNRVVKGTEYETNKARAEELQKKGFLGEEVKPTPKQKPTSKPAAKPKRKVTTKQTGDQDESKKG